MIHPEDVKLAQKLKDLPRWIPILFFPDKDCRWKADEKETDEEYRAWPNYYCEFRRFAMDASCANCEKSAEDAGNAESEGGWVTHVMTSPYNLEQQMSHMDLQLYSWCHDCEEKKELYPKGWGSWDKNSSYADKSGKPKEPIPWVCKGVEGVGKSYFCSPQQKRYYEGDEVEIPQGEDILKGIIRKLEVTPDDKWGTIILETETGLQIALVRQ